MAERCSSHDERADSRFGITRRRFVAASAAVGGTVAGASILAGCGDRDADVGVRSTTTTTVRLNINGQVHDVDVDNRSSLLDTLRERVGLTGTKKGCDQGACGACTVLVNGRRELSCLTLAVMSTDASITTIEGLARDGRLHPLQQAFIDEEGFQCGYCTAGQILSGIGCIREGRADSPEHIREAMSGNICRCGAYTNIVTAIANTARNGEV
jgi:xanthine dehydrogenase YagT iron-sulfur-binding subunit